MAGSFAKFLVPQATLWSGTFVFPAMPMSIGRILAPAFLHIIAALVSPDRKFSATMAVTSCPVWVTPSSTTPLSAHITIRAFSSIFTSGSPVIPAIRMMCSSSFPKLCSGFAIEFHCFFACSMACSSSGLICRMTCSKSVS